MIELGSQVDNGEEIEMEMLGFMDKDFDFAAVVGKDEAFDLRLLICLACMRYRILVVSFPCNHYMMCLQCCVNREDCPLCHTKIESYMELGQGPLVAKRSFPCCCS